MTLALLAISISLPVSDGGLIYADVYGQGERGIVLAHGGPFNKESWERQAHELAAAGYRAIAIDFRGRGKSTRAPGGDPRGGPLHLDVLAAVRYLRATGAKTVSIVGGSMGGGAGADALTESAPGEIQCLVGLGAVAGSLAPEKIKGRKLFIVTRDDRSGSGPRLPGMLAAYRRIPGPKRMIVLDGSAHAQFMFETNLSDRVMREMRKFLSSRCQ